MKPYIYPYNIGSGAARALAKALGTLCVREAGAFRPNKSHVVINWGNPRTPKWPAVTCKWLNAPYPEFQHAQNKLSTFRIFEQHKVACPEWTTDRKVAESWIANGLTVVARRLLNSHSGNGMSVSTAIAALPSAPLYVKYKKKKKEFRVHVFNKEVIDVQQKRLANGAAHAEGHNEYIRSHANGWIFARENITEPKELRSLAIEATTALGLDFGAVDIIWNEKENKCFCLEVNTAPGLEGQTLTSYVNAIKKLIG